MLSTARTALNVTALAGWATAGVMACREPLAAVPSDALRRLMFGLQGICAAEVLQILLKLMPGDAALGVALHSIRFTVLAYVMPHQPTVSKLVVGAWVATELCRYPMFLFPRSSLARKLRYAAPVVTFPIGTGVEAFGAYQATWGAHAQKGALPQALLHAVMAINLLGGLAWYPSIVKKAMRAFGGDAGRKGDKPEKRS